MEDFCLSYLPLHALSLTDFVSKYWPMLVYAEGTIYQADEENEAVAEQGLAGQDCQLAGMATLQAVLQQRGLYTAELAAELEAGQRYWEQERQLCAWMLEHPTVPEGGHPPCPAFTLQAALQASGSKSFDYRVRGRPAGGRPRPQCTQAVPGAP